MDTPTALSTRPRPSVLAALAAAVLLAAVPDAAVADPDRTALELRSTAMTLANDGELVEAAGYLVRTADDLESDDPERDDNLRLAARLYHHAGELEDAWRAMVNAGVAAYRLGDGQRAANDLVDATVVAVQAGNAGRAWSTAEKVGYVLRTADLEPEVRLAILERVKISHRRANRS